MADEPKQGSVPSSEADLESERKAWEESFAKQIPGHWSSHPDALKKERLWIVAVGLLPLAILAVIGFFALSDFHAWMALLSHPGRVVKIASVAVSFFIGVCGTAALVNLMGRAGVGNADLGDDGLEISKTAIAVCSFLWLLPLAATFLPGVVGRGSLIFLLSLLCFVPLGGILLLVLFGSSGRTTAKVVFRRRKFWFALGAFLAALGVLSLLTDVHALLRRSAWFQSLPMLKAGTLRIVLLATLFPLATICFSVWEAFKKAVPSPGVPGATEPKAAKAPWYKRLWRWFFGKRASREEMESACPQWVEELRHSVASAFPNVDVGEVKAFGGGDAGAPANKDPELELLLGGLKPTDGQISFYHRLKDSFCECATGLSLVCPDIVLQGDVGSGRTEVLVAAALYGAAARGQNVLFITRNRRQSEYVVDKIRKRLEFLFLQDYLQCFLLSSEPWTLDRTHRGLPCVYVGTPDMLESSLFDSSGRVNDKSTPFQYRFVQEATLLLFDDLTEVEVEPRSHLVFIIDKLRLLYACEDIVPQFVFVTRRMHKIGQAHLERRLFAGVGGAAAKGNLIELMTRPVGKGWALNICTGFAVLPDAVCRQIIKWCVHRSLNVLLYRKGVGRRFCQNYKDTIRRELIADGLSEDVGASLLRRLAIVSSLDGDDEELQRMRSDVGAVLYFPEIVGESDLAVRLNLGSGEPVFIRIVECAAGSAAAMQMGIPLLPNGTAVPLRNAHLKSVVRFIGQDTPVRAAAWSMFGVDIMTARLGGIWTREAETWAFDRWRDGEDAFVVQERNSILANRIDLGSLPEMDAFDVIRTDDGLHMALGRVGNDNSAQAAPRLGWIKDPRNSSSFIDGALTDLAHANVFTITSDGEVYTKDKLVSFAGKSEPCILAKIWNGDGNDFELPVKTLSWKIEPAFESTDITRHDHVLEFQLPLRHNRYRLASVAISGFGNLNGRTESIGLEKPLDFEYAAHYAGFALCPAAIDSQQGVAYTQATLAGTWTTRRSCGFSPVATHLFSAALKRMLPELPFFATCPVFFASDRPDAVSRAVMWVIEPVNSGETAYPVLCDVFKGALNGDGGEILVAVLLLVGKMAETLKGIEDPKTFVAYLRLLSGTAFDISDFDKSALDADLEATIGLVAELKGRISGESPIPKFFQRAAPPSLRTTWMMAPHPRDVLQGLPEGSWDENPVLSFKKDLKLGNENDGAVTCQWSFEGHRFELHVGFANEADNQDFVRTFLTWNARPVGGDQVDGRVYAEYGVNDPYREYVREVALKLKQIFDEWVAPSDDNRRRLAEFMLYFVQSGMKYEFDPSNKGSDWPRFPSETLAKGGGDCEDTSILYMELLRHVNIDSALFSVPRHACVGVDVPISRTADGEDPVVYGWAGRKYVYAETAMDKGCQQVLGADCKDKNGASTVSSSSIRHVVPTPAEVGMNPVRILNVHSDRSTATVTLMAKASNLSGTTIAVICYARFGRYVFDEPPADKASVCLGGLRLPVRECGIARACTIPLDASALAGKGDWWLDVFACDPRTGMPLGHFVGGELFS